MIKLEELKQILDLATAHELTELEIESEGLRLRVRKDGPVAAPHLAAPATVVPAHVVPSAPAAPAAHAGPGPTPGGLDADADLAVVMSPIVGTFYRAPEPSAPAFVAPGDSVKKGQTLCIIEAMKMMNNIDSDYDGTIVRIYVENGQPVQFGERLFAIKPR